MIRISILRLKLMDLEMVQKFDSATNDKNLNSEIETTRTLSVHGVSVLYQ